MRREPSLTFEGALRILGQHEHKTIEKIDKLLGGVILGGGAAAGAIALGVTPLAPLAAFGVVWGWIEQKGLAVDLLKNAIDAVSGRVSGLRGYERRELIAAAHSMIVVASIFEAFRDQVGEEFYGQLRITDEEKVALIDRMGPHARDRSVKDLYAAEIPAPSAAIGFEENMARVARWREDYLEYLDLFLRGLAASQYARIEWSAILKRANERYRSRYLELAAKVPEFAIWAQLSEHAATRTAVRQVGAKVTDGIKDLGAMLHEQNANVVAALEASRDALNRVAALLSADTFGTGDGEAKAGGDSLDRLSGLRQAVNWANAGILDERIAQVDWDRYPDGLVIPRVGQIYVNPRYKVAEFNDQARPADERWWEEGEARNDFDVFLARYVTSPDATRRPLLLLGHPGAGKSLLTKVFAARLPTSQYTVVRVPLRRVSADAEIHHQIEEALDSATHQRIAWSDFAEQSADTVRVVLLDGLDELLQASEHDRSRYVEDVMDFQEREALQRRPVVAVVTSRTVVVDRVRVPDGTTIVKLDPFNDDDIADWLQRWKRVNEVAIEAGRTGELTTNAVQQQPELAQQPLLLLMLALYAADPELPPLDEDIATAELYRRLLDGFARREASKDLGLGHDPLPDELEQRVRDHLDRLAVAALGMFNRGRQDISEQDLGKDLEALEPRLMERSRHAEAGQRIIGEFFFVHAPEAQTIPSQRGRNAQPQRAYEFLHATFGEYLVARRVMDELVDVAVRAFSGRRGPTEPDDDLLFALLSHQVLAARESMLDFAREIFANLDTTVRSHALETLEVLFSTHRNRHGSDRYTAYRPVPPDEVRRLACYSANLVVLRVLLEPEEAAVPLTRLLRVPEGTLEQWRSTPRLWKAGLDADGLKAMLGRVALTGDPADALSTVKLHDMPADLYRPYSEIWLARLEADQALERRLRYGSAITDDFIYHDGGQHWADAMASWLIPAIVRINFRSAMTQEPPAGTTEEDIRHVARLIFMYLRTAPYDKSRYVIVLQFLFMLPRVFVIDEGALAVAVLSRPELRAEVPELQNFEIYGRYSEIVRRGDSSEFIHKAYLGLDEQDIAGMMHPSDETIMAIIDILNRPTDYGQYLLPVNAPGLGRAPSAEGVCG